MSKRMIVIGLDCLEPSLACDRWASHMPVLTRLRKTGSWAPMRSTIPPITIPAWQCMVTSKDPGTLGMYGFRNRADYTYDGLFLAEGKMVKAKRVWDHLSKAGKDNIILGVPQTYPPRPLRGCMVAGFPLPGIDSNYTYPVALRKEIEEVVDYVPDVEEFRTDEKQRVYDELVEMTRRRFKLAAHLLKEKPWDFFMMVEMGTDRIVHLLWRYTDEEHRHYVPNHPLNNAMRDYYALCDELMGELIAPYQDDPDTAVMVVSDHGARGMRGGLQINEWLIQEGYLTLKQRPSETCSMTRLIKTDMVDWPRTKVWAEGGYYSRIMFNIRDREPQGIIAPEDVPALKDELEAKFKGIADEKGSELATRVYRPENIYNEVNNIPPDMIVIFDDLGWRAIGSVHPEPAQELHVFENDTGPDDANHNWHGVFAMAGGGTPVRGEMEPFGLLDFGPTVMRYFGEKVPADFQGKALFG